jgi:hypothetical protein
MKVFLHTRSYGKLDWRNEDRDFARIPTIGEYLTRHVTSPWYQVQIVVHTPFECEFDAEVYAVEVDHLDIMDQAFHDAKGKGATTPRDE